MTISSGFIYRPLEMSFFLNSTIVTSFYRWSYLRKGIHWVSYYYFYLCNISNTTKIVSPGFLWIPDETLFLRYSF